MKKTFAFFLAAALLYMGMAGCSAPAEEKVPSSQVSGQSQPQTSLSSTGSAQASSYSDLHQISVGDVFINKVQVYDRAMGETTDILDIYDIERIEAALQKLKITDTTVFLPQDQQEIGGMYEISFYDQSAKTPACIIELAPFSFQAGTQKTAYLQADNADAVIQEIVKIVQDMRWVSPTGSFPYTSKALYEYYEENPELKEYYYKYIVPYGYFNGVSSWEDACDIPISAIWVWTWQELTQEEKNALPKHPVSSGNMQPVSLVEEKMQPYFDLDMQALIDKNQMEYLSEYNVFYIPTGSVPFFNWVDAIVDAKQEGDILTLTIRHLPEYNFPEGDWVWTDDPSYSEERDYEMRIRLLDDGTFRYVSYKQIFADKQ